MAFSSDLEQIHARGTKSLSDVAIEIDAVKGGKGLRSRRKRKLVILVDLIKSLRGSDGELGYWSGLSRNG